MGFVRCERKVVAQRLTVLGMELMAVASKGAILIDDIVASCREIQLAELRGC